MEATKKIRVSVVCNAYNHGKYIREALDGFVMQKTDFAFEVLIHDDASTDNTAEIIREFEAKYPDLIKPIYQTENQYSKGIGILHTFQLPRIKGDYVALCEGDDCWTDPLKLQKQFDALEAHPEVDMCATGAVRIDAESGRELSRICPSDHDTIIPVTDVIAGGGGFVATASLFYRAYLLYELPRFRQILRYDYTCQIQGSLRGGLLYLCDITTVYRAMVAGSWTARVALNVEKREKHYAKLRESLLALNEDTEKKYDLVIYKKLREIEFELLSMRENWKKMLNKEYKDIFRNLPFKSRIKIRIKATFPFLIKFVRKIRK